MELIWGLIGRLLAASDLVILLLAYWLVAGLARRRAGAEGLAPEKVGDMTLWLALGAVVGARLVYVLPAWPAYLRYPLDLIRIQNGLSFYGAVAGALVLAVWLSWRRGLSLGQTADLFAPCLALGLAFQRAGCLIRSDCFGALAPPPFGLVFPGFTQPRYPAELYEAVLAVGLVALLLFWRARRRFPGELGLVFLVGYPVVRAGVGFFRISLGGWPTSDQLLSLVVATAAGALWYWRRRRARPKLPEASPAQPASPARRREQLAKLGIRR